MKPEYLNSLKAGIKTAFVTFITTMVAGLVMLMDALRAWTVDGDPPDMDIVQKFALAAVLALLIGLGNTLLRFAQAAAVPFVSALLDKVLGAAPTYAPLPQAPVDRVGAPPNAREGD